MRILIKYVKDGWYGCQQQDSDLCYHYITNDDEKPEITPALYSSIIWLVVDSNG